MDKDFSSNETIHERIKRLVDVLADGKNTVFAQRLGISEANVRGYIKGVVPKTDALEKIVRNYDVSAEWLLTGEGDMLRCAPDESHVHAAPPPPLVGDMLDRITAQAAEIGRLEERIRQLERENDRLASDARASGVACAG